MQVASGTRLGPYEIVSPLGAGGMGEVWRAKDTRLDRSVAIKILPAELAQNAQFKSRFEREAKTISQLNHPNICTLHDVGHDSGIDYLVMELIEGESLADRLSRGAIPISETLKLGAQIADALDRAHRSGIVHRDLKPGNVMLTKSSVKLLDFGLARASVVAGAPAGQRASEALAATHHKPLTEEGTIVGTFQYMAPEQLEGADADPRTDIFALGTVLYEMATGKLAFEGKTRTSLIASIVASDPRPISEIQPLTPPAFEHVVRKCLAKDPDDRWQSAHDVAGELRWISEAGSQAGVAAPLVRRRKRLEWIGWIVAALAIAASAILFRFRPTPVLPRFETAIVPPEGVAFSYIAGSIALSPDGRQLAFVGTGADRRRMIWVRALNSSSARPIEGTEGASYPFWSPDGRFLAFAFDGKLKKIGVTGGAPETLADAPGFSGGSWSAGDIVYGTTDALVRVSSGGGKRVTLMQSSQRIVSSPRFLPDGRHFLFTSFRSEGEAEGLSVGSIDGEPEKLVLPSVYSNAAYAPDGFIVYSREGDLRAQRFDAKTLRVSGDPIRLVDRVQYDADSHAALFAVSDNGVLVYAGGEGAGKTQPVWVSRDGKDLGSLAPPAMFYSPRLSHDEKRVVVDLSDPENAKGDIWIFDLIRNVSTRLTSDPANESSPLWSGDDRNIVFFSEKRGHLDLYRRPSGGTGTEELLLADGANKFPIDISPDGRWLAYARFESPGKYDIWLLDLQARKATPLFATPFSEADLHFSPDGKWIVYGSDESGRSEVYVQEFPLASGKWIISRGGGMTPVWSADGREIYYISRERKMMTVPVTLEPQFDSGTPVALFEARVRPFSYVGQYAVTRDKSRFLLNRTTGEEGTRPMTVVLNWTSGLE